MFGNDERHESFICDQMNSTYVCVDVSLFTAERWSECFYLLADEIESEDTEHLNTLVFTFCVLKNIRNIYYPDVDPNKLYERTDRLQTRWRQTQSCKTEQEKEPIKRSRRCVTWTQRSLCHCFGTTGRQCRRPLQKDTTWCSHGQSHRCLWYGRSLRPQLNVCPPY